MGELASLFGGGDSVSTTATASAPLTASTPFVNNADVAFGFSGGSSNSQASGAGVGQANPTSTTSQTPTTTTTGPTTGTTTGTPASASNALLNGSDTWLLILGAAVAAAVVLVQVLGKK